MNQGNGVIEDFRARFKDAVRRYFMLLEKFNQDRGSGLNRTNPSSWSRDTPDEEKFESGIDLITFRRSKLEPIKKECRALKLNLSEEFERIRREVL